MARSARPVAVWIMLAGIVVLVLTAAVFHRPIIEFWYLTRLQAEDPAVVTEAARRLGSMGSIKGLAALLRLPEEGAWDALNSSYRTETLVESSETVLEEIIEAFDEKENPSIQTRAVTLLERLGPGAKPGIVSLLRHSRALSGDLKLKVVGIASKLLVGAPEMMDDVMEALEGQEYEVRLAIQYAIQFAALEAPEIIPRLLDGLRDPSVVVRVKIAETIGSLGERAKGAVPVLVRSLGDGSPDVRYAAARALGGMGEAGGVAVRDLIHVLEDETPAVRDVATRALAVIARQVPDVIDQLIAALEAESIAIRSGAARALGGAGKTAAAVAPEALAKSCRDPAEEVRRAAVISLGQLGTYSRVVAAALLDSCEDSSAAVRRTSIMDLSESGQDPAVLVPVFVARLEDETPEVHEAASHALRRIATTDAGYVVDAAVDLKSRPEAVRHGLVFALSQSGAAGEAIVIEALGDQAPSVRLLAVMSLASSESELQPLLPHLLKTLDDPDSDVRDATSQAVATLATRSPSVALPALIERLEAGSERVRAAIALGLAHMGAAARDAVPALITRLEDSAAAVRENAALALGEIGEVDARTVLALLPLLEDALAGVSESSVSALAKLARDTERGLPEVLNAMKHDSPTVRSGVLHALFHVKDDDRVRTAFFAALRDPQADVRAVAAALLGDFEPLLLGSIKELTATLGDEAWRVRQAAVSSLGRCGGAAAEAVPALLPLLDDPDADVREVVATALAYIVRGAPETRSHLKDAVESESSAVRRGAAEVLEAISVGE